MLSVAEARARVLALVAPLGGEEIPLAEAGGRILLRDVVATRDQPPFAEALQDRLDRRLQADEADGGLRHLAGRGRRDDRDV